jgi:hypothetical protein
MDLTVGLDLGQLADPSALIVSERLDLAPVEAGARISEHLLRHLRVRPATSRSVAEGGFVEWIKPELPRLEG